MTNTVFKQFVAEVTALTPEEKKAPGMGDRCRRFVISTGAVDRDNDTIDQLGWQLDNYRRNPVVLWAHDYSQLPVGKAIDVHTEGGNLVATVEFEQHDFAETVFQLVNRGTLRATSVGFRPTKLVENVERGGLDFKEQELLEFSIVPVPANAQALITMGADDKDVASVTKWANDWLKALAVQKVPPQAKAKTEEPDAILDEAAEADPIRWNRSLSKAFDVDGEPLQAHKLEYTWVSRYLDTPVKNLYETTLHVGGARVGAFLTALEEGLSAYQTASVRNVNYESEKEVPPVYETMQLNSKLTRSFLVKGLRFLHGPMKMVVKVQPSWAGIALTSYIERGAADKLIDFLSDTGARASSYKFLKGEAFSVSGEFIERDGTSWDDLVLANINLEPITRTVKLLNEQGGDMEARGMILMGPPGTGKTLAGRVMMNEAKNTTFIWVSARDMGRMGSFGGITQAFDLAVENAPSIVFLEDVDDAISYNTDLLKTELDGVQKRKAVVTVVTTNFPEQLPKALIDRPGRFHDVLQLDLPVENIRRAMLAKWAPDADTQVLDQLAKDTFGMSGAHIRELVRFANVIRSQDGLALDESLVKAFQKVKEQREVIDTARGQRTLRSVKALAPTKHHHGGGTGTCSRCEAKGELAAGVCAKCANELQPWDHEALISRVAQMVKENNVSVSDKLADVLGLKAGRKLSKANESRLRQAKELLDEVLVQLEAPADTDEKDEKEICPHGIQMGQCPDCHDTKELCPHGAQMGQCPECNSGKAVEPAFTLDVADDDEFRLELAELPEASMVIDIDPDMLRQAMAEAVKEVVGGVVRDATASTLARMRGRVD